MTGIRCGRERSWPDLKQYSDINLQRMRKTTQVSVGTVGVTAEIQTERLRNGRITSCADLLSREVSVSTCVDRGMARGCGGRVVSPSRAAESKGPQKEYYK